MGYVRQVRTASLFELPAPVPQESATSVRTLEEEVRAWYTTVSGLFPDTVAKRPRQQTITRGMDALRVLLDMGFDLEQVKATLQWGLAQSFWSEKIVYLHNLTEMLSGEPITWYESLARAHRLFITGNCAEGADNAPSAQALPEYAERAIAAVFRNAALTARQRAAVAGFLTGRIAEDHKLLAAHFETRSHAFWIMYPTKGAFVRAYVAYCNEYDNVSPYQFIGTHYAKFLEVAVSGGSLRLLARLRKKQ